MAVINLRSRQIQIKIVYYGPALSGKTETLAYIHRVHGQGIGSELLKVSAGDRTVLFDFLTFTLSAVNGFSLVVRLYSVPGREGCDEVRRTLLKGVDGIVFVADASAMRKTNILSLKDLQSNLAAHRKFLERLPLVFQFNKYDLARRGVLLLPRTTLLHDLNAVLRKPSFVTSAADGKNIVAALKKIITMTAEAVERRYREVT
jgi:signal recognition particle receptor subunit beta